MDASYNTNQKLNQARLNQRLFQFVFSSNTKVVQKFIRYGANVNQTDRYGDSLLIYATKVADILMVKCLIKSGADPSLTNFSGWTALVYASQYDHKDIYDYLRLAMLKNSKVFIFMNAARCGNIAVLGQLIKNGTPINQITSAGFTALMFAAEYGGEQMVNYLIQQGADVDVRSYLGYTAFTLAFFKRHHAIASTLFRFMSVEHIAAVEANPALTQFVEFCRKTVEEKQNERAFSRLKIGKSKTLIFSEYPLAFSREVIVEEAEVELELKLDIKVENNPENARDDENNKDEIKAQSICGCTFF